MNPKLWSLSIVPMLFIGSSHILANVKFNPPENWHFIRSRLKVSQVKLDTQQPPPLSLAAKDDRQKECLWLGICDDKEKKK